MTEHRVEQILRKAVVWHEQERKQFGPAELEELAATIRVHGILEPLGVTRDGDGYVGLFGQRRWMAAELAGLERVPAIVRDKPTTEAGWMEIRLIENISRENLRPLEQAVGLDQLMKAGGLSASDVAKRVGMKPAAVTKSLRLLSLPGPIRQQIDSGLITAASAYELTQVENPSVQAELAAQVAAGQLSRDGLIGAINPTKRRASKSEGKHTGATARLDAHRHVTVRGENLTVESFIATLEDLLARCRAARTKGLSLRTVLNVLSDESRRSSTRKEA
jgi:ParB/RepB/Spo0J family partition protein